MGKKVLLGCLGFATIVMVGGGIFLYSFLYKPAMEGFNTLKQIDEANTRIVNQQTHNPPQSGELSSEQVERFVQVQTEIQRNLENRFAEFQQKYDELDTEWDERDPSFREMMGIWDDLSELYLDAKQIQVDALNNHNFSLGEYRWVQQSFYQALGVELFSYNIDNMAKAARDGNFDLDIEQFEEQREEFRDVPERNRQLVQEYSDSIDSWITFAFWGL